MRLSMQCDSGGARARSEERALGLTPFSQIACWDLAKPTSPNLLLLGIGGQAQCPLLTSRARAAQITLHA